MTPEQCIDRMLTVPYARGRGDWSGMDCWGVVELWYRHVLGVELSDRTNIAPGHDGVQKGFDAALGWRLVAAPVDHCAVVMRAHGFEAGHIGIYYNGSVLHTDEAHGCVYQPITDRVIRTKITAYGVRQ